MVHDTKKKATMNRLILSLPDQIKFGLTNDTIYTNLESVKITNVVIVGMGGSAIGGDVIRCCAADRCPVPVIVNRDYEVPAFVDYQSLVFIVSYSGNTEESLHAFEEALAKNAQIVAISSGGELSTRCKAQGIPLLLVPEGLPPRTALGYLFVPIALTMEVYGLLPDIRDDILETVDVLRTIQNGYNGNEKNHSITEVAEKLHNSLPLLWSVGSTAEVAAMRWKGQLNENTKSMAYYNCFPELNHNEICSFDQPHGIVADTAIIILDDQPTNERNTARAVYSTEILQNKVKSVTWVKAIGKSKLARLFSLIYIGDHVSVKLAELYGIDPFPVSAIDKLKERMGGYDNPMIVDDN